MTHFDAGEPFLVGIEEFLGARQLFGPRLMLGEARGELGHLRPVGGQFRRQSLDRRIGGQHLLFGVGEHLRPTFRDRASDLRLDLRQLLGKLPKLGVQL